MKDVHFEKRTYTYIILICFTLNLYDFSLEFHIFICFIYNLHDFRHEGRALREGYQAAEGGTKGGQPKCPYSTVENKVRIIPLMCL